MTKQKRFKIIIGFIICAYIILLQNSITLLFGILAIMLFWEWIDIRYKQFRERFRIGRQVNFSAQTTSEPSIDITEPQIVNNEEILPPEKVVWKDLPRLNRHIPQVRLGQDTEGNVLVHDYSEDSTFMVCGEKGSGKSVHLHTHVCDLAKYNSPTDIQMLIIDPKKVEFAPFYEDLPHLWKPVATEFHEALEYLSEAIVEMNNRYQLMSKYKARKYEEMMGKPEIFPRLFILIDEVAKLMLDAKREGGNQAATQIMNMVIQLIQEGRAAGVYTLVSTQLPYVKFMDGCIKGNIKRRLAGKLPKDNSNHSINFLGYPGAENLQGNGDFLVSGFDLEVKRIRGTYIESKEIVELVEELKKTYPMFKVRRIKGEELKESKEEYIQSKKQQLGKIIKERGVFQPMILSQELKLPARPLYKLCKEMIRENILSVYQEISISNYAALDQKLKDYVLATH